MLPQGSTVSVAQTSHNLDSPTAGPAEPHYPTEGRLFLTGHLVE